MGDITQSLLIRFRRKKRVKALFDSGAQTSFIREDIAKHIGAVSLDKVYYTLPDGSRAKGKLTNFFVQIQNKYSSINAIITPHIKEQLIIGSDFMQDNNLILDLAKEKYRFPKTAPKVRKVYKLR